MRRLIIVNWFLSSCWDVHTFVVPILGHERGYSASVIGSILGVFCHRCRRGTRATAIYCQTFERVGRCLKCDGHHGHIVRYLSIDAVSVIDGACSVALGFVLGSVQPMIMSTLHQITPEASAWRSIGFAPDDHQRQQCHHAYDVRCCWCCGGHGGLILGNRCIGWFGLSAGLVKT